MTTVSYKEKMQHLSYAVIVPNGQQVVEHLDVGPGGQAVDGTEDASQGRDVAQAGTAVVVGGNNGIGGAPAIPPFSLVDILPTANG